MLEFAAVHRNTIEIIIKDEGDGDFIYDYEDDDDDGRVSQSTKQPGGI